MFYGCSSLKSLADISKWKTKKVNNMNGMLNGCSSLISLPVISKLDHKIVTDMSYIFNEYS